MNMQLNSRQFFSDINVGKIKRCTAGVCFALALSACSATQETNTQASVSNNEVEVQQVTKAPIEYQHINVVEFEKSMTLYRVILGFDLVDAEVLNGPLAEVLVLKLQNNNEAVALHVLPEGFHDYTNLSGTTFVNELNLNTNDITAIVTQLLAEGYTMNMNGLDNAFIGPNGETVNILN